MTRKMETRRSFAGLPCLEAAAVVVVVIVLAVLLSVNNKTHFKAQQNQHRIFTP